MTIRRSAHRSTTELEAAIKAYLDAHNANPKPFRWTNSADDILAAVERFCQRTVEIQSRCA
jgi:hypothetical protein